MTLADHILTVQKMPFVSQVNVGEQFVTIELSAGLVALLPPANSMIVLPIDMFNRAAVMNAFVMQVVTPLQEATDLAQSLGDDEYGC